MFVPPKFKQSESTRIFELMRDNPFALLCVAHEDGVEAGHVPVHTKHDENGDITLGFHLSRNNPLVKMLDGSREALIVFTGPNAYISPDWYGTENQVPTWNYAVVQARGKPVVMPDAQLMVLLDELSAQGENELAPKPAWTTEKMDASLYDGMRTAITGYAMKPESVTGKWKMNQNRKPGEREQVKKALAATGNPVHLDVLNEIPD